MLILMSIASSFPFPIGMSTGKSWGVELVFGMVSVLLLDPI